MYILQPHKSMLQPCGPHRSRAGSGIVPLLHGALCLAQPKTSRILTEAATAECFDQLCELRRCAASALRVLLQLPGRLRPWTRTPRTVVMITLHKAVHSGKPSPCCDLAQHSPLTLAFARPARAAAHSLAEHPPPSPPPKKVTEHCYLLCRQTLQAPTNGGPALQHVVLEAFAAPPELVGTGQGLFDQGQRPQEFLRGRNSRGWQQICSLPQPKTEAAQWQQHVPLATGHRATPVWRWAGAHEVPSRGARAIMALCVGVSALRCPPSHGPTLVSGGRGPLWGRAWLSAGLLRVVALLLLGWWGPPAVT